ncbi:Solute carrier family 35 member F6 ANT2-binding protein [Collichthys lucidus]|uniref:Solute carrier family 35 member F6 n=1 Tax=Collichthys lucidus TaxID=240159 RepID=A0A4U5UME8_COLLU|nr:Solute carrier family 35 member F6 ANT2-binding protein [Collichthys lucidus]
MTWTKYQLFLAGLMLTTGSLNTLSAKWADLFSAKGCHDVPEHNFSHPFVQAVGMFLGELSCLAVFYILLCHDRRNPEPRINPGESFNPLLFFPPAMCDMTATSIMYVALNMTSASSFQMLRGAVIIFTGLLSVAFLGRRLLPSQWLGIFITILGLVIVGLADFFSGHQGDTHKLSDIITGFFGFFVLSLLLIPMYFIPVGDFADNPRHVLEDALDAFCQIGHKPLILLALLGNTVSIAFFNFAGISVTKEISATTRMVLDSLRTLVIWVVSLALGWEQFHGLQVLGFLVLLLGTGLYNGLHRPVMARIPCCAGMLDTQEEQNSPEERERLLGDGKVQTGDES